MCLLMCDIGRISEQSWNLTFRLSETQPHLMLFAASPRLSFGTRTSLQAGGMPMPRLVPDYITTGQHSIYEWCAAIATHMSSRWRPHSKLHLSFQAIYDELTDIRMRRYDVTILRVFICAGANTIIECCTSGSYGAATAHRVLAAGRNWCGV